MLYRHWSDVPETAWGWPHFSPRELASKGNGSLLVVPAALDVLETARVMADRPFYITSAYRDPIHNALVGGAPLSRHKQGDAFDISLRGHSKDTLINILRAAGFRGFGINYAAFVHADLGRERSW